jgi:hypothetical protein
MGTITKNYIIIILFEKIIMKKECQYCHHLNQKKISNKLAEKPQLVSSQQ